MLSDTLIADSLGKVKNLTETEALQRKADGRVPSGLSSERVPLSGILKKYLWTPLNADLLGLTIVLLIIGRPLDALLSAAAILLSISITVLQEWWAHRQLERISAHNLPRIHIMRDDVVREVNVAEVVQGDVVVVGVGEQIPLGGMVVGDGHIVVDGFARSGTYDRILKKPGDAVQSGSVCLAGMGAIQITEEMDDTTDLAVQPTFRKKIRPLTPLQILIQRVLIWLLVLVGILAVFVIADYVIEISRFQIVSDAYRNLTLIIFGLAPSSLFFLILVYYALGAAEIGRRGALLKEVSLVETIAHSTTLAVSQTGILTRMRVDVDLVPEPGGSFLFRRVEVERILGDFAFASSSTNEIVQAVSRSLPGRPHHIVEETTFSPLHSWSAIVFDDDELRGVFVLGRQEMLEPQLLYSPDSETPAVTSNQRENKVTQGIRAVSRFTRGRLKDSYDSVRRALTPRDVLLLEEAEAAEFLLAYYPEVVTLRTHSEIPKLPVDLIPLCYVRLHEQVRANAEEMLRSFAESDISLKVLSTSSPSEVYATAHEIGMIGSDQPDSVVWLPDSPSEEANDGLSAAIQDHELFANLDQHDKEEIIRLLQTDGEFVSMVGSDMSDLPALESANVAIAMQSSVPTVRSRADVVLLKDSLKVLSDLLKEGQRVLNQVLDVLKLYLTRILYTTILIIAIQLFTDTVSVASNQINLVMIAAVDVPGIAIAFLMKAQSVPSSRMVGRLKHFILPAGFTIAFTGFLTYRLFLTQTGDPAYASLTLVYALIAMGLALFLFVEPPFQFLAVGDVYSGEKRNLIVVALTLLSVFLLAESELGYLLFGLSPLNSIQDLLLILGLVVLWGVGLQLIWRVMLRLRNTAF